MQSQNISNKSARDIEKYVLNVVSDVVSSQCVIVNNGVSMLWSGRNTILFCIPFKLKEECLKKNGKCKVGDIG